MAWLIRDGDRGGVGGGGNERVMARQRAPTRKTEGTVDRRQNNQNVKLRQCPLAIAYQLVYHSIAVSAAVRSRVTRTMSIALVLSNNWIKRSPAFWAQLHLPALDLFWADLSAQHHLLISPGPQMKTSSW